MDLRARISAATKQAMKDRAAQRLSTLRLINATIKDRDIAARGEGNDQGVSDSDLLAILAKMVKQRRESASTYEEGGRLDLAEAELAEIEVIEEFLPKPLSDEEISGAVDAAMNEVGASSIRDMGRVMGVLKGRYQGQMDFGAVGSVIKERLSAAG
ncbi:GatB/YqeY domain-containing protein [Citreicella sp. C3M06]|uniref:GatB/YqeY domain-containing protein n=1 Tax=Roseobacteraceae TaxID=2854170 RepID=UPI001C09C387|nr:MULTISPECIES: GatB/YqeY domain-containing protein [Roseobacteraceae]MBU2960197.1 GatB/YqeY domain-containing protein [Citreicella sp. C3M06]MDO6586113.1 GatB/YqeY domain-containing protein [Salipiger sp. 1_MG-2023]